MLADWDTERVYPSILIIWRSYLESTENLRDYKNIDTPAISSKKSQTAEILVLGDEAWFLENTE